MLCPHRRTVARLALEAACLEPHLELAVVLGVVCVVLALRHRCDRQREPAGVSLAMASVPRQRAFVIMLSCLSAAAALPRPPPRKVARAFANPVLRLLPDAHRLASLRGRPPGRAVAAPVAREAANRAASTAPRRRAVTVGPRTRFFAACAGELAVVRWVVIVICLLCCASRSCVLATCADLLSPPALLCHVAVCVWVSMFAIWILDFLRLFV